MQKTGLEKLVRWGDANDADADADADADGSNDNTDEYDGQVRGGQVAGEEAEEAGEGGEAGRHQGEEQEAGLKNISKLEKHQQVITF